MSPLKTYRSHGNPFEYWSVRKYVERCPIQQH